MYRQLLTNLLSNSINYSDQGTILVKFTATKVNDVDSYIVSVSDEGVGIPDEELRNIFIPYNRGSVKNSYNEGTGLGLAICQEIVEGHGGTISASNNQEIGSIVEFIIPIKK